VIKPGLGRGLGQLLKDAKVDPSLTAPAEERESASLTTGMKTLIRGNNTRQTDKEETSYPRSIGFSLLGGDIVLCLIAWRLVNQPNEVHTMDRALALGAVIAAGWLGWLGVRLIAQSFNAR